MNVRRQFLGLALLISLAARFVFAEDAGHRKISRAIADAAIAHWPDGPPLNSPNHKSEQLAFGLLLHGVEAEWLNTADPVYFDYIRKSVDQVVAPDGLIQSSNGEMSRFDTTVLGRQLLLLYGVTLDPRYAKAATTLFSEFQRQNSTAGDQAHSPQDLIHNPDTSLMQAEPFYAEYAATFDRPDTFKEIARQFSSLDEPAQESTSGKAIDGRDVPKQGATVAPKMGLVPLSNASTTGSQMIALVETLAYFPENDSKRAPLVIQFRREAADAVLLQDEKTGLWSDVPNRKENKTDRSDFSGSSMIIYALAKGVRLGYLPERDLSVADRGFNAVLVHSTMKELGDQIALTGNVLGDPMEFSSLLLASTEIETMANTKLGRGKTVLLDAWFNSQKRPDAFGQNVHFHYKWNDQSNSGYSLFGHIFNNFGAMTRTLEAAPTEAALNKAQVYIIVSPDIPVRNPDPHYMNLHDASQIAEWVKRGGVLMIMENDPANADLLHLNLLAEQFGLHFNSLIRNKVDGDKFEMGKISIDGESGPIFHNSHSIFMKEICTISISPPAAAFLKDHGDVLLAASRYGKGTVFAAVDPWLYNEYTDGRRLPSSYDNYAAGEELVRWVLKQITR
jgi:unsaturated rhamnogalacturonyl hydrolase